MLEEDGRIEQPESGTPQGGSISPVLANVYLHYVLDLWFERRRRQRYQGQSWLFRFADDFVCCFDHRHEAEAFEQALPGRLSKFGLELAADKTRWIRFGPWGGRHNGRFDFLGLEFSWGRGRRGQPTVQRRTSRKKLRGAVQRFTQWIKAERHSSLGELMGTLTAKYTGHWNYYGIIGNSKSLSRYCYETSRILFQWLNRRSQRRSYTWKAFNRLLQRFKVPPPRVVETAWGTNLPCRPGWRIEQVSQVKLFGAAYRPARACVSCREEPGAGKPPAGICEGGAGQPASLPRSPVREYWNHFLNSQRISVRRTLISRQVTTGKEKLKLPFV